MFINLFHKKENVQKVKDTVMHWVTKDEIYDTVLLHFLYPLHHPQHAVGLCAVHTFVSRMNT